MNQPVRNARRAMFLLMAVACWPLPLSRAELIPADQIGTPLQVSTDGSATYTVDSQLGIVATVSLDTSASPSSTDPQSSLDGDASAASKNTAGSESGGGAVVLDTPIETGPLIGDINQDNKVDFRDFQILQRHYGETVPANTSGDLNGDGIVNFQDFQILQVHYGEYLVPEPTSLAIWGGAILLAILYGLHRRAVRTKKVCDVPRKAVTGCAA